MFAYLARLVLLLSLALSYAAVAAPSQAAACVATPVATPVATFPLTLTDDAGRTIEIAAPPQRIISLAPSNTEILYALGLEDRVVAVDQFSDYPAAAAEKPHVGGYLDPDIEGMIALAPDLMLATAAHEGTILPRLEELGIASFIIEPTTLDEILESIATVGTLTGEEEAAARVVCSLQARVEAVEDAVAGAPATRVFFEISLDLYTAGEGSYIDDLMTRAGGDNIIGGDAGPWPQVNNEAVIAADPEVILLADHELGVTPESVAARPGWQVVSAVADDRVVALEMNTVVRPGPRVVEGLETIARALHPERFPEG